MIRLLIIVSPETGCAAVLRGTVRYIADREITAKVYAVQRQIDFLCIASNVRYWPSVRLMGLYLRQFMGSSSDVVVDDFEVMELVMGVSVT